MEGERESYESVSNTSRSELDNFEKTKSAEIQEAICNLIQANINYELRVTDLWKSFLKTVPSRN